MFTGLADGWVEVGLMEGKVTVYVNVTQKKNTRIDISSGKVNSLLCTLRILQLVVTLLLPTVIVNFLLFKFYGLTFGVRCRFRSEWWPVAQCPSECIGEPRYAHSRWKWGIHCQNSHPHPDPNRRNLLLWRWSLTKMTRRQGLTRWNMWIYILPGYVYSSSFKPLLLL